jgi:signal transduction histidine kinase
VEAEVAGFADRQGVGCEIQVDETLSELDSDRATALFRILKEALTNVARHAEASHLTVRLSRGNGTAVLEVADDGVGMDERALKPSEALGLLGMRERAEAFGGSIHIEAGSGDGTRVTATLPVPSETPGKDADLG